VLAAIMGRGENATNHPMLLVLAVRSLFPQPPEFFFFVLEASKQAGHREAIPHISAVQRFNRKKRNNCTTIQQHKLFSYFYEENFSICTCDN
jgi:hypothetical protein